MDNTVHMHVVKVNYKDGTQTLAASSKVNLKVDAYRR